MSIIESLMASIFIIISFKENEVVRPPMSSNEIVTVGVISVEVVNVNKLSSFVNYNLIIIILQSHELVRPKHSAEN